MQDIEQKLNKKFKMVEKMQVGRAEVKQKMGVDLGPQKNARWPGKS
jgi:hypothetical protein